MKFNDNVIAYNKEIVGNIFKNKKEFHIEQAALPIEEKIKIMVELQKIVLAVRTVRNEDDNRRVWEL